MNTPVPSAICLSYIVNRTASALLMPDRRKIDYNVLLHIHKLTKEDAWKSFSGILPHIITIS